MDSLPDHLNSKIISPKIDKILKNLVFQGAKAASLLVYQNGKLVFYKTTNSKYQDAYLNSSNEVPQCHLAAIATKRIIEAKPYTLIWDSAVPTNDASYFLNEQRLEYEHCHGITFLNPMSDSLLFGVTLAGRRSDINLPYDALQNKHIVAVEFQKLLLATKHPKDIL